MYEAIAMLYLGLQAEDDNKMGFRFVLLWGRLFGNHFLTGFFTIIVSRVSYFDCALEHVTVAMKQMEKDKRESLKEAVIFLNDIVLGKLVFFDLI